MGKKNRQRRKAARKQRTAQPLTGEQNITYISGLKMGVWLVDLNWVRERVAALRSTPPESVGLADVLDWFNSEGRNIRNATVFGPEGFLLQIRDGKVVALPEDLSITEIRNGEVVTRSKGSAVKVEGLTPKHAPLSPPLLGQFILEVLLPRKEAEHVIGDLVETYNEKALKYGVTKAKIWFWTQVASSVRPLVRRALFWVVLWLAELLRTIFKG
jgi:hypothetical protein